MKYNCLKDFVQELKKFNQENDAYISVDDIPSELKLGFAAIGDNESKFFHITIAKLKKDKDQVFSEAENQIIADYLRLSNEFREAEKRYIEVFAGKCNQSK